MVLLEVFISPSLPHIAVLSSFLFFSKLKSCRFFRHVMFALLMITRLALPKYTDKTKSVSLQLLRSEKHIDQGRSQDLARGGPRIFFSRFGNLHVAKRHAAHGEDMRFVRGVRGHAPPRKFF